QLARRDVSSEPRPVPVPRGALLAGLVLVVVACPLIVTPFSFAPFSDGKLFVLAVGAMLVAIGSRGSGADRRLVVPASAFVAVGLLAAAFGVDPMRSLLGPEQGGTGVLLLASAAMLLVAGSTLPDDVVERLPRWFVGA